MHKITFCENWWDYGTIASTARKVYFLALKLNDFRFYALSICIFLTVWKYKTKRTSWDELSSHQAEADSLNLASSYGYITTQF